jgi:hypothetical protein
MASLAQAMKVLKFDSRVIEINLATGLVKKDEWEKYLQSLPDSGANSTSISIEGEDFGDSLDKKHQH